MVNSFLLAHGRQILGIHQHPEEMVKWVGLDELLEASGVEAEGAECVWERSQHLACHWNLCVWMLCIPSINRLGSVALRGIEKRGKYREIGRLTCLLMMELSMTQGRPLSCNGVNWDGSWKINTVATSVAVES